MSVVTNTSPLIALAKIDQLFLLEQMFEEVHIPPTVHRELLAKSGFEAARLDKALSTFIQIVPVPELSPEVKVETANLDKGEKEAVALAYGLKELLIIDDRLGRKSAQRLGISITGFPGVLIQAKKTGLVASITPLLEDVRRHGYWLSDALVDAAKKLAGED